MHPQTLLDQEARALLTRLDQVRPFALNETMVVAAALPFRAHRAIEQFLHTGRNELRRAVHEYRDWLHGPGSRSSPAEQQRRFVLIRLQFNNVLSQFDLFTEVFTQRSEHATGVWLSGLDALAADAITLDLRGYDPPPVVCYLARGPGAAIRRARTRLPGGAPNPVAIIRVPRERMVGHGIASSLVHEVGHQVAALLALVESLRPHLAPRGVPSSAEQQANQSWSRWISEIVADLWSVGLLGIAATLGLLAVVSLPRFFVFRPSGDDPHPTPYVRVLLSTMMGEALYPHPQWESLRQTWKQLYPTADLPAGRRREMETLEAAMPEFVATLLAHRPPSLHGATITDVLPVTVRQPSRLSDLHETWTTDLGLLARQRPSLVFAVVGQARAAGRITPEVESHLLTSLLNVWAVRSSLDVTDASSFQPSHPPAS